MSSALRRAGAFPIPVWRCALDLDASVCAAAEQEARALVAAEDCGSGGLDRWPELSRLAQKVATLSAELAGRDVRSAARVDEIVLGRVGWRRVAEVPSVSPLRISLRPTPVPTGAVLTGVLDVLVPEEIRGVPSDGLVFRDPDSSGAVARRAAEPWLLTLFPAFLDYTVAQDLEPRRLGSARLLLDLELVRG